MKQLLTILLITLATSIIAQTNSTDTVSIDSYVTHQDSQDSLRIEMTPEELDEANAYINGKSDSRREAEEYINMPSGVVANMNQDYQDYTNFYYRKKRTTLIGLLLP